MTQSGKRVRIVIVFVAIIGVIGYLIVSGLENTLIYSRTISEIRRLGTEVEGQGLRIEGTVLPGSLEKSENNLRCQFMLADSLGETMEVRFDGILPDTFKEGLPAVAEGFYHAGNYFEATNVLTKCPSKYEPAAEKGDVASPDAVL